MKGARDLIDRTCSQLGSLIEDGKTRIELVRSSCILDDLATTPKTNSDEYFSYYSTTNIDQHFNFSFKNFFFDRQKKKKPCRFVAQGVRKREGDRQKNFDSEFMAGVDN